MSCVVIHSRIHAPKTPAGLIQYSFLPLAMRSQKYGVRFEPERVRISSVCVCRCCVICCMLCDGLQCRDAAWMDDDRRRRLSPIRRTTTCSRRRRSASSDWRPVPPCSGARSPPDGPAMRLREIKLILMLAKTCWFRSQIIVYHNLFSSQTSQPEFINEPIIESNK